MVNKDIVIEKSNKILNKIRYFNENIEKDLKVFDLTKDKISLISNSISVFLPDEYTDLNNKLEYVRTIVLRESLKKKELFKEIIEDIKNLQIDLMEYDGEYSDSFKSMLEELKEFKKVIENSEYLDITSSDISLITKKADNWLSSVCGENRYEIILSNYLTKLHNTMKGINLNIDDILTPYYQALERISDLEDIFFRNDLYDCEFDTFDNFKERTLRNCIFTNEEVENVFSQFTEAIAFLRKYNQEDGKLYKELSEMKDKLRECINDNIDSDSLKDDLVCFENEIVYLF